MRTTQGKKKIQIQPIKSPSPDIANRNFISDTIAPLKQIEMYQESRSRSRSPRISNSIILNQHSSTEVDRLKYQVYHLREQLKILKDRQSESHGLYEKNNMLMQQIYYLRSQLERVKKLYLQAPKPYEATNYSNTAENDKILKQFNQRLLKLTQQNKKLCKKIQDLSQRADFLNKQNQMLKNQVAFYKKAAPKSINQYGYSGVPRQQIEQAYRSLQMSAEQREVVFQNQIKSKIQDLELKINKIKVLQNILDQRIEKQKMETARSNNNSSSPPKYDYSIGTTWRGDDYDSPMRLMTIKETQQQLRTEKILLANRASSLTKEVDYLKQECNERDRHINTLQSKIKQLTSRLQKQPQNIYNYKDITDSKKPTYPSDINMLSQSQLTFLKQKVKYLQSDIKNKSNIITNLQQQNSLKKEQSLKVKSRLDEVNYLLQNQMSNFQKVIDQERIKNQRLQEQNSNLTNKINEIQNDKVNELSQMKQQLSKFPKLLNDMKYLEQQTSKKSIMLTNALREYLKLIQQIKLALSSQKIEKVILDTNSIDENLLSIQKMKEQSMSLVTQLRKKLLAKEAEIVQLKRDNGMLRSQIQHMETQKLKLKQLIQSYASADIKYTSSMQSSIKNSIKNQQNSKISYNLKQCLQEAMAGIVKLQSQVSTHLSQLTQNIQH